MKTTLLSGLLLVTASATAIADEYLTFFMGGQSNMVGYGKTTDLPDSLKKPQDVMIFHGNPVFANQQDGGLGKWSKLQPGYGEGFKSDGKQNSYSTSFGSELTFAASIAKACSHCGR